MATPRQIIAQNVRRGIANLATPDLEYSTDDGGTWSAFVGNAVLHVETADLADHDPELGAEGNSRLAILKVSDDATTMPAETWLIRDSNVAGVAWEVLGSPSIHSGQRMFRCGFRSLSPGNQAGPDRGQTR